MEIQKTIGKGTFGVVYQCKDLYSENTYAVKRINRLSLYFSKEIEAYLKLVYTNAVLTSSLEKSNSSEINESNLNGKSTDLSKYLGGINYILPIYGFYYTYDANTYDKTFLTNLILKKLTIMNFELSIAQLKRMFGVSPKTMKAFSQTIKFNKESENNLRSLLLKFKTEQHSIAHLQFSNSSESKYIYYSANNKPQNNSFPDKESEKTHPFEKNKINQEQVNYNGILPSTPIIIKNSRNIESNQLITDKKESPLNNNQITPTKSEKEVKNEDKIKNEINEFRKLLPHISYYVNILMPKMAFDLYSFANTFFNCSHSLSSISSDILKTLDSIQCTSFGQQLHKLREIIRRKIIVGVRTDLLLIIAHDISKGQQFLTFANLIHRDIKPHNVLMAVVQNDKTHQTNLTKTFSIKAFISDFGATRTKNLPSDYFYASPMRYRSFEQWCGIPHTQKSDVFSFGQLLMFLLGRQMDISNPGSACFLTISATALTFAKNCCNLGYNDFSATELIEISKQIILHDSIIDNSFYALPCLSSSKSNYFDDKKNFLIASLNQNTPDEIFKRINYYKNINNKENTQKIEANNVNLDSLIKNQGKFVEEIVTSVIKMQFSIGSGATAKNLWDEREAIFPYMLLNQLGLKNVKSELYQTIPETQSQHEIFKLALECLSSESVRPTIEYVHLKIKQIITDSSYDSQYKNDCKLRQFKYPFNNIF